MLTQAEAPALTCPIPISDYPTVLLAHGGGGKLMHHLLENLIVPAFDNPLLAQRHDGAVLRFGDTRLAFTTDSFVVHPLFFPGGDIGQLAVNGTVNDLAMCGARPLYLSAGFILEEGLPMETLWRVVASMQQAAQAAGVSLVTGDTKVVDRGKGDGLYINTSGLGLIQTSLDIAPASVRPGDAVLLSGDLGRHGIAIMAAREGLAFESEIESDWEAAGVASAHATMAVNIRRIRGVYRELLSLATVSSVAGSRFRSCRRYRPWEGSTWLNERHMAFAWFSLIWVAFTDFYIYLVSTGTIRDLNT